VSLNEHCVIVIQAYPAERLPGQFLPDRRPLGF